MDFVRLALVNLYKASPKQARYYLFNNTNPIYKLSTAVKSALVCNSEGTAFLAYFL